MNKNKKEKIIIWLRITLFCLFYYLQPSNNVWAKECSQADIDSYIQELNNTAEWIATIAALRKCGSPAVETLASNLHNQDEKVRINAASALASMGIGASSATPALAIGTRSYIHAINA